MKAMLLCAQRIPIAAFVGALGLAKVLGGKNQNKKMTKTQFLIVFFLDSRVLEGTLVSIFAKQ